MTTRKQVAELVASLKIDKRRDFIAPRGLGNGGIPRSVPADRFLWHNYITHCVGMPHGLNGFRYWHAKRPINYRIFERCHCGVVNLPHYKHRGEGSGKCVEPEHVYPFLVRS